MVEGARLESVYAGNRIEGSNPFLSAKPVTKVTGFLMQATKQARLIEWASIKKPKSKLRLLLKGFV